MFLLHYSFHKGNMVSVVVDFSRTLSRVAVSSEVPPVRDSVRVGWFLNEVRVLKPN